MFDMRKPAMRLCVKRNLRSFLESAQTDQSHHCTYEDSLGTKIPTDCTGKTQNRLGGCPG